jgi:hypothetical protein
MISFEDRIPEIQKEIQKRKNSWRLSTLSFEDVSQQLLFHAFKKYHTYDENKSEFSHWINRLISNQLRNILRDNLGIFSRPCIMGCVHNLGDEFCDYTESKKQCSECPLYAKWEKKKKDHFNVAQSLPLSNHEQEVNSKIDDFFDMEKAKAIIDVKIKQKLNNHEWQIYSLLFIQNKTSEEAQQILNLKYNKKDNTKTNYQQINKVKKRIIVIVKEIINEEGLT